VIAAAPLCRRSVAALLVLWGLAACHSVPLAGRRPAAGDSTTQNAPPASTVEIHEIPSDEPIQTPIIAPPCLPAEMPQKPKPKSTPKDSSPTAPPPNTAERPTAASVDVEIRPMDVSVASVLGKKVQGSKGEDLGRVVDVLADSRGRVRAAVIEFGGFLGVGNRRIAIDWSLLRFAPEGQADFVISTASGNRFQSVPEYKNAARPQALMAPQIPSAAAPSGAADGKK
jgi:sporulation protein YlmC with PRC-barrel domain